MGALRIERDGDLLQDHARAPGDAERVRRRR